MYENFYTDVFCCLLGVVLLLVFFYVLPRIWRRKGEKLLAKEIFARCLVGMRVVIISANTDSFVFCEDLRKLLRESGVHVRSPEPFEEKKLLDGDLSILSSQTEWCLAVKIFRSRAQLAAICRCSSSDRMYKTEVSVLEEEELIPAVVDWLGQCIGKSE